MNRSGRESWYAVLSASPRPENGERINVAIAINVAGRILLEYDHGLSRLGCLIPPDEVQIYKQLFRALHVEWHTPEDVIAANARLGPHLTISSPVRLFKDPTPQVVQQLITEYLGVGLARAAASAGPRPREQRVLDQVLSKMVPGFGVRIEKSATPRKLYPSIADQLFKTPVPPIERAIRSARRDVLIGSVEIGSQHTVDVTRAKTARVSQALWQYKKARPMIEDALGREVRLVGVLLNGSPDPRYAELKQFVEHLWAKDADEVVEVHGAEVARSLQAEIDWLIEDSVR